MNRGGKAELYLETVYIKTMGCKVNSFDGDVIANQFLDKGYKIVNSPSQADVSIINSCSVTENADKEARYLARKFKRSKHDTFLVVTGCYAQTDSAKLASIENIDFIVPNEVKTDIVDLIVQKKSGDQSSSAKIAMNLAPVKENRQGHFKSSLTYFDKADSINKSRVFLKIQDGCNGFCSYCLIPYARGQSRSVPRDDVIREVKRLVDLQIPEIVFTGIHIGDYGNDFPSPGQNEFVSLLQELVAIPGETRFRISSLEPNEVSPELIELMKANEEKFCQHFHLPLQSGCDPILKKMRRTYDTAEYQAIVELIRSTFPNVNIGADVICGFPGESDFEFQATVGFIAGLKLSYLHVFPYSKRPNTAAARLPGHLDASVVSTRRQVLQDLSDKLYKEYATKYINSRVEVVWNQKPDRAGRLTGISKEYLQVKSKEGANLPDGFTSRVELKGFLDDKFLLGI